MDQASRVQIAFLVTNSVGRGRLPPHADPRFRKRAPMNTGKIQSLHYERMAYVYVRQSPPGRSRKIGKAPTGSITCANEPYSWAGPRVMWRSLMRIKVEPRNGRPIAAVFNAWSQKWAWARWGIVLMLEASRLARNNSDWYRLIEICGLTRTLIGDEQAIYSPREPNDRLLLGVKGTLSEAELFTLRTRLYEGRWNKARKG